MFLSLISLLDKKSHILFLQLVLNQTGHSYFKMRNPVISQLSFSFNYNGNEIFLKFEIHVKGSLPFRKSAL